MPRLWTHSIEAHHREVRDAILVAAAGLVAARGPSAVTMSEIAEAAGIGRATLYKYFADVEAILVAWHDRHIAHHLEQLTALRDRHPDPRTRLAAILEAFGRIAYERTRSHGPAHGERRHARDHAAAHVGAAHELDISAVVHRNEHVAAARRRLVEFLGDVVRDAARAGAVRDDIPAEELAAYCLHALEAAGAVRTTAAVDRLVAVTLDALRPTRRR